MRSTLLGLICLGIAGCAGSGPDSACEIFTPAPAETPAAEDAQGIEDDRMIDATVVPIEEQQRCP